LTVFSARYISSAISRFVKPLASSSNRRFSCSESELIRGSASSWAARSRSRRADRASISVAPAAARRMQLTRSSEVTCLSRKPAAPARTAS
jgi:hypothetical protein